MATNTITGQLIGYARVSTDDQEAQLQRDALTTAGCARIFEDKASGKNTNRPELTAALDYARPGDTLCVWKLDRFARSLIDLVTMVDTLREGYRVQGAHGCTGQHRPRYGGWSSHASGGRSHGGV